LRPPGAGNPGSGTARPLPRRLRLDRRGKSVDHRRQTRIRGDAIHRLDEGLSIDDEAIRAIVTRLARPNKSGGEVIERAAILAEGSDAGAIIAWIIAHAGEPEAPTAAPRGRGLHGSRLTSGGAETPLRFVLPASALTLETPRQGM